MRDYKSLSHARWNCKHHTVFIPKYVRLKSSGLYKKGRRDYSCTQIWVRLETTEAKVFGLETISIQQLI